MRSQRRPFVVLFGLLLTLPGGCGESEQNAGYFTDASRGGTTTLQQPVFETNARLSTSENELKQLGMALHSGGQGELLPDFPTRGTVAGLKLPEQAVDDGRELAFQDPAVADLPGEKPARNPEQNAAPPKDAQNAPGDAARGAPVPLSRRIIYTASLNLVVKDFSAAEKEIAALVDTAGGYVSKIDISRRTGTNRFGSWTIRIPVLGYDSFLKQLDQLGVPENLQQQSQDVTQQFIDLGARVANQQRLEARLIKLLEDREGELKEVIEVERELARVRSEIEQMQGQLRYLQNQVSMTTVTIQVREEQDYKPPQAPTFGSRIGEAWSGSLHNLSEFGQALTIILVAAAPWMLPVMLLVLVIRWLIRSRQSRVTV